MNFDKLEYQDAALEQAPQTLTVSVDGQALFESHTNSYTPDHPEIGTYQTVLKRAELEALKKRLSDPPFAEQRDHWGEVRPGDRYRRIRLTVGSGTTEKLVGTMMPVDAALEDLLVQLEQIARKVARHPLRALRGELSRLEVDDRRAVTALFTLSNAGSEALNCRNPASLLDAPDGDLSFEAWPDKPARALKASDVVTFDVLKVVPIAKAGADGEPAAAVTIPPKGSAAFRLEGVFPPAGRGTHLVRLKYESLLQQVEGLQVIVGELLTKTVKAKVP